jgi:hypothetical protein
VNNVTNKGGAIVPAPRIVTEPVLRGAGTTYQYDHWWCDMEDVVQCLEFEFVHDGTHPSFDADVIEHMNTWFENAGLITTTTAFEFRFEEPDPQRISDGNGDLDLYNPIAWLDVVPSLCVQELMLLGAGVDSQFYLSTSRTAIATHYAAYTPDMILRPVLYGKKFSEHTIELLSYMPATFLHYGSDGIVEATPWKIQWELMDLLASASSPFTFTEAKQNYSELITDTDYVEKLATTLRVEYHAYVDNGYTISGANNRIWNVDRDWEVGRRHARSFLVGSSATPLDRHNYRIRKTTATSVTTTKDLQIDRPWLSVDTDSDHYARAGIFIDEYLEVWDLPKKVITLVADHRSLTVENGDVVEINVPSRGLNSERFRVVGKTIDLDSLETEFTLMDVEFDS